MTTDTDWAEKIGKPAASALREMVAALECDYERLDELREERDEYEIDDIDANLAPDGPGYANDLEAWVGENPEDAEELKELEEEAGDCKGRDDAEQRIHEDPLSVEVRSDWVTPGSAMEAGEFMILLATGGPAVRIMGELDEHGEPYRAWLEVQDWFKSWTEYFEPGLGDVLLTYSRCFTFGS